jgi:hypothetical protein
MAWFERWDDLRKPAPPIDQPSFQAGVTPPPPTGWSHGDDVYKPVIKAFSDPPSFTLPVAVTVGVSGMAWFTSSIIGISGSYLGYSLVYYSLYFANVHWHTMSIRLIGAIAGAAVILVT